MLIASCTGCLDTGSCTVYTNNCTCCTCRCTDTVFWSGHTDTGSCTNTEVCTVTRCR